MQTSLHASEWAATPRERRSAALTALTFLCSAIAITPLASIPLRPSLTFFAMMLAASLMGTLITGLLLLFQARAQRSMPVAVLAAGFFVTSATMVPYMLVYPHMMPSVSAAVQATNSTNGWLWFAWHVELLSGIIAFGLLRRVDTGAPAMQARGRAIMYAFAFVYIVGICVAFRDPALPTTFANDSWTPLWRLFMVPVIDILAACVIVGTIRRRSTATLLDLWLAVVAFSIAIDIYLTTIGLTRFTLGWYASRIVVLFATLAVLGVLLRQAALMYAALVERAEMLEGQAHTDMLTGLSNRRRFDEEFARAFGSSARNSTELSIALIDIDRFKLYNDAFGHQAGDEALHRIAQAIDDSVGRSGDFAARYGGEEFVVILEDTSLEGAMGVSERIRNAVLDAGIRAPQGGLLSISIGVSARKDRDAPAELLRRADAALYLAKNAGRNRVTPWLTSDDMQPIV